MKQLIMVLILCTTLVGAEEVCYEGGEELITSEYRVDNVLVSVNWYDTEEELVAALEAMGYETENSLELSECEVDIDKNIAWCEVWLVFPKHVLGDPNVDALGHEALHGLIGDFHAP